MTSQVIDRNAEFAAERAQQISDIMNWNAGIPARREAAEQAAADMRARTEARIASGELVPVGGGRYRATAGWDAGETWRLQVPRGIPVEQPLLLPESYLDMSRGRAALYTRKPAWHGLGTVIPEGVTDLDEVLRLGGIDFEVGKRAVRYCEDEDALAAEITRPAVKVFDRNFVSLRLDTMAPLGCVGPVWTPIQNKESGAFLQWLVDSRRVAFESAGATYGGAHVFIGMKLPENVMIDLGDGRFDEIIAYLYWLNGHDGRTGASVTVSPWRVECGNTERFNLRDAVARWRTRHTTNVLSQDSVKEARETLAKTVKYFDSFRREGELLARTPVTDSEFDALIKSVYDLRDDATERARKSWDERAEILHGMYRTESEKLGRTAYAAERVFTDWYDHVIPRKATGDRMAAARATALIEGTDDAEKTTVHRKLLTLASR